MSREYVFEFRLPQNPFQVIEQLEEIAVYLETKRDNAFKSVPKPCEVVVPGYARGVFVSPEGIRSFANRLSRLFLDEFGIAAADCSQPSMLVH